MAGTTRSSRPRLARPVRLAPPTPFDARPESQTWQTWRRGRRNAVATPFKTRTHHQGVGGKKHGVHDTFFRDCLEGFCVFGRIWGSQSPQEAPGDPRRAQEAPGGLGRHEEGQGPGGTGRAQESASRSRRDQAGSGGRGGPRRAQEFPGGPRKRTAGDVPPIQLLPQLVCARGRLDRHKQCLMAVDDVSLHLSLTPSHCHPLPHEL